MNVGLTERLARASSARPWLVIGAWMLALAASIAAIVLLLGSALTAEQDVTSNPESKQADALLVQAFPDPDDLEYVDEVVVVRSANDSTERVQAKAAQVREAITATGVVREVGQPRLSSDRSAAALTVVMAHEEHDPETAIEDVIAAVERESGSGFAVTITGAYTADRDFLQLSEDDLRKGEFFFGAPAALIILMLVFGAVVAGLMPLMVAVVAIIVALALGALVGQFTDLSVFFINMLTGMGLALGIDYCLFILSRYREERARGTQKEAAIFAAAATSSRAVLFSGLAFVLALFGMVMVPDTIMRSLGIGAILVGLVAVVAALTLLPAVLTLVGDRVDSLRIPGLGRGAAGAEGRFWGGIVRRVMRRPVLSLVLGTALLLAATAPLLDIKTGFAGISTMPDRFPSKQGFVAYTEEFGGGETDPAQIVVEGDPGAPDVRAAIERLEQRLAADEVFGPPTEQRSEVRDVTFLTVPVRGDAQSDRAVEAVKRLRNDYIPAAFAGTGARALVTGETAANIDYFALMRTWLPRVFAFVLGLSFLLLMLAFRSIVVPLKAILLNLLSVGAAYGLLVLVFQKGIGNELFGFQQVDAIEAWVPLFLFSVLFGLSMDYHVFLLSRIRERFVETRDNDESVAWGVGSTARLITGAALIIIAVFAGFARGDLVMFQQMGFGVAVSLLIDATLIRSVLVPASMKLLRERNWYLPPWLECLPHVSVEGPAREVRVQPAPR